MLGSFSLCHSVFQADQTVTWSRTWKHLPVKPVSPFLQHDGTPKLSIVCRGLSKCSRNGLRDDMFVVKLLMQRICCLKIISSLILLEHEDREKQDSGQSSLEITWPLVPPVPGGRIKGELLLLLLTAVDVRMERRSWSQGLFSNSSLYSKVIFTWRRNSLNTFADNVIMGNVF